MQRLTALEILNETCAAYTLDTRAREGYACRFETSDGKRCAVGRCMLPGIAKARDHKTTFYDWDSDAALDADLCEQYRGYPLAFWRRLQLLHDNSYHWDSEGLSPQGEECRDGIAEWISENGL